jgi:hypothetical protein
MGWSKVSNTDSEAGVAPLSTTIEEVPMSTRHRARQTGPSSALQEEREQRKAEHRRVRRTVNQSLHVAVLEEDHDGLVLELPHPTHGYTDEHEPALPHAAADPRRRMKHWKQSFWKRRTLERRRKALAEFSTLRQA